MENNYLSVVSDQKRKLKFKPLKRTSHYLMENPSVFLNHSYINFSSSAFKRLGFDKYKHCQIVIEEGIGPEEALALYLSPNNDPASDTNCPIRVNDRKTNFSISCFGTIAKQIPKIVSLLKKPRQQRRIFLIWDDVNKMWKIPLKPCFEYRNRDLKNLIDGKGIYRLLYNGDIQYIGETNNINRRVNQHLKNDEIKFDTVEYSVLSNVNDDERKKWEDYHLKKFIDENGLLPPHNRIMGKQH